MAPHIVPASWTTSAMCTRFAAGSLPSSRDTCALEAHWGGHTEQILTALAIWIAIPLAVGVRRTMRREVT